MAGNTNFPTALDDDSSLFDVSDGVSSLQAAHHNNLKEAIKALESKVGIYGTNAPTALDYRVGHPTSGHSHNSASGQGPLLSASVVKAPSGAVGGPTTLHEHMMDATSHGGIVDGFHFVKTFIPGSAASGANRGYPFVLNDAWGNIWIEGLQLVEVVAVARRPPSGATTVIDINIGATSIWHSVQSQRLMLAPGATYSGRGTFSNPTYFAGNFPITVDVDAVGNQAPGEDISINFVFRHKSSDVFTS